MKLIEIDWRRAFFFFEPMLRILGRYWLLQNTKLQEQKMSIVACTTSPINKGYSEINRMLIPHSFPLVSPSSIIGRWSWTNCSNEPQLQWVAAALWGDWHCSRNPQELRKDISNFQKKTKKGEEDSEWDTHTRRVIVIYISQHVTIGLICPQTGGSYRAVLLHHVRLGVHEGLNVGNQWAHVGVIGWYDCSIPHTMQI